MQINIKIQKIENVPEEWKELLIVPIAKRGEEIQVIIGITEALFYLMLCIKSSVALYNNVVPHMEAGD